MTEIEKALVTARMVFTEFPKRIGLLQDQLKKCDQESQDLLHLIELTTFNAAAGYKLAKELQLVRKRRREIKNELELLEPINQLSADMKLCNDLNRAIGEVRKAEKNQSSRTYRMRIRNDLQELMK